jgi:hypothetical protein
MAKFGIVVVIGKGVWVGFVCRLESDDWFGVEV